MSSHADVIDPSRTIRKDNDIKELDQLIGRNSPASDAEDCSPVNRLSFPQEGGIGLKNNTGIKIAAKGL